MYNLPAVQPITTQSEILLENQTEYDSLAHVAGLARRYAREFDNEFGCIQKALMKVDPKAAARFRGLLSELILMTSVTANRVERMRVSEEKYNA
ncbi:MAG: hypothetical protein ACK5M5_03210 [Limnobaculum xujianqingii]